MCLCTATVYLFMQVYILQIYSEQFMREILTQSTLFTTNLNIL